MEKILDPSYLFNLVPGAPNLFIWKIFIGIAIASIIIGIIATVLARRTRKDNLRFKPWYRLSIWGYVSGLLILVLAFFRFQNAFFLGMRLWIFTWLLGMLIWLGFIIKYWIKDLPKKIQARKEDALFKQYLPRKK